MASHVSKHVLRVTMITETSITSSHFGRAGRPDRRTCPSSSFVSKTHRPLGLVRLPACTDAPSRYPAYDPQQGLGVGRRAAIVPDRPNRIRHTMVPRSCCIHGRTHGPPDRICILNGKGVDTGRVYHFQAANVLFKNQTRPAPDR